jgi:LPS sulfotransferase NodH
MEKLAPIFIVGAPRSGTTLLASFFASHSLYFAGPETHFYNKFLKEYRLKYPQLYPKAWPNNAVRLFQNIRVSGRRVSEMYDIDEKTLVKSLDKAVVQTELIHKSSAAQENASPISLVLKAMLMIQTQKHQKRQWVENTPNHLLHVKQIRRDFPNAIIIRMVRDAKDTALSMKALPWAYDSMLANACLVEDWHQQSDAFFTADDKAMTVRFEDLVTDITGTITSICKQVGVHFEPQMLARQQSNELANFVDEPWKKDILKPIDSGKAFLWKHAPNRAELKVISGICRHFQTTFSYSSDANIVGKSAQGNITEEHKNNSEDNNRMALITVKESSFSGLDSYSPVILASGLSLSQVTDTPKNLLFFEKSIKANVKLFLKASFLALFTKASVYYVREQKCASAYSMINRILFKAL